MQRTSPPFGARRSVVIARAAWAFGLLMAICVGTALGAPDQRCATGGDLTICVDPGYPSQGRPCRIRVTRDGQPAADAMLAVTYRPNSEVSHVDTLGRADETGVLMWTPQDAGIATLSAAVGDAAPCELIVSVRFRGIPVAGVIVMVVAGLILFGGNSYSFAKTFGGS